MSKSVGRNDPCPCGSGKKYKKCCARKEQEQVRERVRTQRIYEEFDDTIVTVGRWLSREHARGMEEISRVIFRALYSPDAAEAMPDRIEAHEQTDALSWNSLDAALAYWTPTQMADPTFADLEASDAPSVRDELAGEGGPRMTAEQRSCVRDLLESPMRAYEVTTYAPNETLVLTDLATGGDVTYPYPTASFEQGSTFATRVVARSGGGHCMMGFLPLEEAQREAAIEAVKAYDQRVAEDSSSEAEARRSLFLALWRAWLAPFAGPQGAESGENAEDSVGDEGSEDVAGTEG